MLSRKFSSTGHSSGNELKERKMPFLSNDNVKLMLFDEDVKNFTPAGSDQLIITVLFMPEIKLQLTPLIRPTSPLPVSRYNIYEHCAKLFTKKQKFFTFLT